MSGELRLYDAVLIGERRVFPVDAGSHGFR